MKLSINHQRCSKCGVCVSLCPDLFSFDRKGQIITRHGPVPQNLEHECRQTSEICPLDAIEINQ
ncbi:MAG: ferredoxin [Fibrobacter sp.]|nr:ferredoxin [Fibrobacter sp.]